MISYIKSIRKKDNRSTIALLNVIMSFIIKGISILVSLVLVPLTLHFLDTYEYGLWLTISSILLWIDYFDIGLGNGLRNKLSEALVAKDMELAKEYVSTTFFVLLVIATCLFGLFVLVNQWIDWGSILNIPHAIAIRVANLLIFVFLCVTVSFVLKIVTYVYFVKQLPVVNGFIYLLSQLLSLFFVFLLAKSNVDARLEWVAYSYSASTTVVLLLFYPITFCVKYKELAPSIKAINMNRMGGLMDIGFKFFLIQLSSLVIYTTSNLIISNKLSPEEVTPYSISFRYFNIIFMVFTIIVSPMWSAVNEAYNREEYDWIKRTMKTLNRVLMVLAVVVLFMILFSDIVYRLWLGTSVIVPFDLTVLLATYVFLLTISSLYSNFLNGMNKLNIQLYTLVIAGIVFIPLSILLLEVMGVAGVALALCIVTLPGAIINIFQYRKVIGVY